MKDYCGKSIAANYYRGIEAVGGKLIFDDTGITFKSHALNIQTGESRIEYKDVLKADVCLHKRWRGAQVCGIP